MTDTAVITTRSAMREILEAYPGAQRTLFRQYHLGGCSQCSFQPEETLEQLCGRSGGLAPDVVLAQIRASHEQDTKVLIAPRELEDWRRRDPEVRLVDVRSREEFQAVHIEGSLLLSQEVMRSIMGDGSNERPIVVVDHQGKQGLDAAAYFSGHGLKNVRSLRGGIDAWAVEVDPAMRRYRVG